jgi:hypothetical protein
MVEANLYEPAQAPLSDTQGGSQSEIDTRRSHLGHEASLWAFGLLSCLSAVASGLTAVGAIKALGSLVIRFSGLTMLVACLAVASTGFFFAGRGLRGQHSRARGWITRTGAGGQFLCPI